jgi:hypothetical protein
VNNHSGGSFGKFLVWQKNRANLKWCENRTLTVPHQSITSSLTGQAVAANLVYQSPHAFDQRICCLQVPRTWKAKILEPWYIPNLPELSTSSRASKPFYGKTSPQHTEQTGRLEVLLTVGTEAESIEGNSCASHILVSFSCSCLFIYCSPPGSAICDSSHDQWIGDAKPCVYPVLLASDGHSESLCERRLCHG